MISVRSSVTEGISFFRKKKKILAKSFALFLFLRPCFVLYDLVTAFSFQTISLPDLKALGKGAASQSRPMLTQVIGNVKEETLSYVCSFALTFGS